MALCVSVYGDGVPWHALTPAQQAILTDGCGIFTACGRKVRIVMGSTKNIKITTPPDLATANAFLAEKA
jgi:2-C-methyl-D-erythritol 4-phosphate cytidylyltransferase